MTDPLVAPFPRPVSYPHALPPPRPANLAENRFSESRHREVACSGRRPRRRTRGTPDPHSPEPSHPDLRLLVLPPPPARRGQPVGQEGSLPRLPVPAAHPGRPAARRG